MGLDIASKFGAALTILHICEIPSSAAAGMTYSSIDLMTPLMDAARSELDAVVEGTAARLPRVTGVLRLGVPWREILAVREEAGADLIVMGTHGRTGVAHALIGSVAERVVRASPVPVLTVHASQ